MSLIYKSFKPHIVSPEKFLEYYQFAFNNFKQYRFEHSGQLNTLAGRGLLIGRDRTRIFI